MLPSYLSLQKSNKGSSRAIERLKKKMFEYESWLLLFSPTIPFRIHNKNGKVSCGPGLLSAGSCGLSRETELYEA